MHIYNSLSTKEFNLPSSVIAILSFITFRYYVPKEDKQINIQSLHMFH